MTTPTITSPSQTRVVLSKPIPKPQSKKPRVPTKITIIAKNSLAIIPFFFIFIDFLFFVVFLLFCLLGFSFLGLGLFGNKNNKADDNKQKDDGGGPLGVPVSEKENDVF